MPNWCENKMIVAGKKDVVESFLKKTGEDFKMLENHLPTPIELLNSPAETEEQKLSYMSKYGSTDWYWWRVHNWGTKWDLDEPFLSEEADDYHQDGIDITTLVMHFNTAWAPPEEGIRQISAMYNNLLFHMEFEEPGMAFEGHYRCMNGIVLSSETRDMDDKFQWIVDDVVNYWEKAVLDSTEQNSDGGNV